MNKVTDSLAVAGARRDVRYWLGIDAGGTKSRARLVDGDGREIGRVSAGPGNLRIGVEAVEELTLGIARQALEQSGLSPDEIGAVSLGLGLAGLSRASHSRQLAGNQWPFARVTIASDAEIAHLGAHGGEDGAILIVGTGSIAYLKVDGNVDTMGGYGFPISDEASGAALGLSAVRHALRALDGRTRSTPLSDAVTGQFGNRTVAVIEWMETATPGDFAAFAPLVISYAERGDYIARSIVIEALIIVSCGTVLAAFVPGIGIVVEIIGTLFGIPLMLTFPGLIGYQIFDANIPAMKNAYCKFGKVMSVFLVVFGMVFLVCGMVAIGISLSGKN